MKILTDSQVSHIIGCCTCIEKHLKSNKPDMAVKIKLDIADILKTLVTGEDIHLVVLKEATS